MLSSLSEPQAKTESESRAIERIFAESFIRHFKCNIWTGFIAGLNRVYGNLIVLSAYFLSQ